MKIKNICVISETFGTLEVSSDNVESRIQLSPADCQQVMYLAERLYEQHQQRIAEEFAKPLPALADFSEVPDE